MTFLERIEDRLIDWLEVDEYIKGDFLIDRVKKLQKEQIQWAENQIVNGKFDGKDSMNLLMKS